MNDLSRPDLPAVTSTPAFSLVPRTLDDALKFAKLLSQSELVPKDYQGKEANCFVAMQWGNELGLPPLQAMQNIAVINGRPSLWGDSMIALVRASPLCEYIHETELAGGVAEIRTKRRGDPHEHVGTFSDADAKQAGLHGKSGPWTTAPKRMKKLRARAFLLRDVYPDVLRGMDMAEAVADYEPMKDVTPTRAEVQMPQEKAAGPAVEEAPRPPDETRNPVPDSGEPAKAVEGVVETAGEQKAKGDSKLAPAGLVKMINTKANQSNLTDADIAAKFGLPLENPLAGITTEQGNSILEWIRGGAK
jgi:hypothetical protein